MKLAELLVLLAAVEVGLDALKLKKGEAGEVPMITMKIGGGRYAVGPIPVRRVK